MKSKVIKTSPQYQPVPGYISLNQHIDAVLVSHFHVDHCGALPYLTQHFQYRGPIVMTQPTRSIVPLMLRDFAKIQQQQQQQISTSQTLISGGGGNIEQSNFRYSEAMIQKTLQQVQIIQLHETISILEDQSLLIKCYYAGHVLGAAIFYIQCGDQSIVYTGDFNMTADRHLAGAWIEKLRPTLLITQTTYATTIRQIKKSRQQQFLQLILQTLENGGKVLIPVFALGRAQQLCVLLESFWIRCGLSKFPIYFAANLSQKANFFYKTFLLWTNDNLQKNYLQKSQNLFDFKYVKPWDWQHQKSSEPMVVLASPGMIHAGSSLTLFADWCGDSKNTVIIPGYCMKNTIGGQIIRGAKRVTIHNRVHQVKCKVEYYSFSAHADYAGIMKLIECVRPQNLMLVHGEKQSMETFKDRFQQLVGLPCYYPPNGSLLKIDRMRVEILLDLFLFSGYGKSQEDQQQYAKKKSIKQF